MRKIVGLFIIPLLFLFLSASQVAARVAARDERSLKVITLPSDEVITKDFYINGGDVVEISGTVNGDVIVGAGQVTVAGTVNGDVLVAGGSIDITGTVSDDVRAVGGQINISGKVGRNITIGGGDIKINEGSEIGGGVVVGGGNVRLAGTIGGDVLIASGNVTLSGDIGGDAEIYAGTLVMTSNTKVGGDLVYTSEEEAVIDKQATISGKLLRKTAPALAVDANKKAKSTMKDLFAFGFQFKLVSFLSALIVGSILIRVFPKYTELTKSVLQDNLWKSLLYGFLFLFIAPFAIIILFITILGAPLAMFGIMAVGVLIYLSKIFMGYWLGAKIPLGDKKNSYLSFVLGLAAFYLITMIPILGGFVSLIALFFGVGSGLLACREYYQKSLS